LPGDAQLITTADFNGDGRPDLACSILNQSGNPTIPAIAVLLNQGNGSFVQSSLIMNAFFVKGSRMVDFDGDGNVDIVGNGPVLFLGDGKGKFGPPYKFPQAISPYDIAVADYDKDGTADLLLANNDAGTIGVMLNSCGKLVETHSITGRISEGAVGLSGVTVALSGGDNRTTVTDSSGNYSFTVAAGRTYTITPSRQNYSFGPTEQSFVNVSTDQTQNFTATRTTYFISGDVTEGGVGLAGVTLTLTGGSNTTLVTDNSGHFSFPVAAGKTYTITPSRNFYSFGPTQQSFANISADQVQNFTASKIMPSLQFSGASFSTQEGTVAALTVVRSGDPSQVVSVDYATVSDSPYAQCAVNNGLAAQNCDFLLTSGTLTFAAGETSKTVSVITIDDTHVEGPETLGVQLSNPNGATLGTQVTATLTIADNDSVVLASNPVDAAQFFVQQQYYDFLNRVPDQGGFDYWTGQLTNCGTDLQCIHDRRIGVSDAFFFEPEFQESGAYVYRIYKAAFGQVPTYAEFMPDRSRVIGGTQLSASKAAFALSFVGRNRFVTAYPRTMTADQFVTAVLNQIQQSSGADLQSQKAALVPLYDGTDSGRTTILMRLADDQAFIDAEYRRSFVLMEYFGYLRRDPDQEGFNFWLGQVNRYPVRDVGIQWAMVCSFVTSAEYQLRFGSAITHSNKECPQ
jgi:hypothetical protein